MIGFKDIQSDMSDLEYERYEFQNDTLADDAEVIRQWQDEMATHYSNNEEGETL